MLEIFIWIIGWFFTIGIINSDFKKSEIAYSVVALFFWPIILGVIIGAKIGFGKEILK